MSNFLKDNGEVVGFVYKTSNLGMFNCCKFNRIIDEKHVNRLVKSMRKNSFNGDPIRVTLDGIVLYGHHRLQAAMRLGIPINYTIDESEGEMADKIIKENEIKKPWTKVDYIEPNIAKGIQSYDILKKFDIMFPEFSNTEQLMMLSNNNKNVEKGVFTSGNWESKDVRIARQWASDILKLKTLYPKGYRRTNFVRVMIDIFSNDNIKFNMDEFIRKVELRRGSLYHCGNKQDYKKMIENCYNFGRRQDERISLV